VAEEASKCCAGKMKDAALGTAGWINQGLLASFSQQSHPHMLPVALMGKWFAYTMAIVKGSRDPKFWLALLKPFQ